VVFSSHQLELVERLCDSVAIVNHGRIVAAGRVDDLRAERSEPRLLVEVEANGARPAPARFERRRRCAPSGSPARTPGARSTRRRCESAHWRAAATRTSAPGVAFVASLLLYLQLIGYGLAVATGVVEEKASRVVEVLLAAIPARALLAGKLIGIGLLGLIQLLLVGVVGLAAAVASGALELDGATLGALGVALLWFLFGYALWTSMFAVAGAIVSRQEDLQSSSPVLTLLLVVAYLVALPVIDDPSSPLATVSALVPLSSPIVMPALVALGEASAVEIAASLAVLAPSVAVLVRLGASIYEGAILRMGRPLKLAEAWRAARA
jgi:ABC-2 type transport system permease protein